jgi:hypothetical protein
LKRDMDLIREILLKIEANPDMDGSRYVTFTAEDFDGSYTNKQIQYHVDLLFEARLVDGAPSMDDPALSRLTWEGHEFLSNIHDPGIWASVKERAKELPELTFALAWELAKAELKKKMGLL